MDALDHLFRRLAAAAQAADALARPLEVAEILEQLVPYRAARRDGQLDTNDDYLHAMMQLLSGERGYVFVDDLMQDDLRSELASPNPDLTVLRTYRSAKVRIASTHAEKALADGTADLDLRPPTPASTASVPSAAKAVPSPADPSATQPAPTGAGADAAAEPAPAPRVSEKRPAESPDNTCPYCSQALPKDRDFTYCPACGLNLRIRRCAGCSAEMESEWKFCVTCGRSAA